MRAEPDIPRNLPHTRFNDGHLMQCLVNVVNQLMPKIRLQSFIMIAERIAFHVKCHALIVSKRVQKTCHGANKDDAMFPVFNDHLYKLIAGQRKT